MFTVRLGFGNKSYNVLRALKGEVWLNLIFGRIQSVFGRKLGETLTKN